MGNLLNTQRVIQPLKDAGLWEPFKAKRETLQAELGGTAYSHTVPALVQMLVEANAGAEGDCPYSKDEAKKMGGVNMRKSIEFVFNYLSVTNPNPALAPCAGAWGMLLWAQKNPAQFYTVYAVKLVPTKAEIDKNTGASEADSEALGACDDALKGIADGVHILQHSEDEA